MLKVASCHPEDIIQSSEVVVLWVPHEQIHRFHLRHLVDMFLRCIGDGSKDCDDTSCKRTRAVGAV